GVRPRSLTSPPPCVPEGDFVESGRIRWLGSQPCHLVEPHQRVDYSWYRARQWSPETHRQQSPIWPEAVENLVSIGVLDGANAFDLRTRMSRPQQFNHTVRLCWALLVFALLGAWPSSGWADGDEVYWRIQYADDVDESARRHLEHELKSVLSRAEDTHLLTTQALSRHLTDQPFKIPHCFEGTTHCT